MEEVVLPAAGNWRELDRNLRHELDDRALHLIGARAASKPRAVCHHGSAVRTSPPRARCAHRLLADPVLDVAAEDFPAYLNAQVGKVFLHSTFEMFGFCSASDIDIRVERRTASTTHR